MLLWQSRQIFHVEACLNRLVSFQVFCWLLIYAASASNVIAKNVNEPESSNASLDRLPDNLLDGLPAEIRFEVYKEGNSSESAKPLYWGREVIELSSDALVKKETFYYSAPDRSVTVNKAKGDDAVSGKSGPETDKKPVQKEIVHYDSANLLAKFYSLKNYETSEHVLVSLGKDEVYHSIAKPAAGKSKTEIRFDAKENKVHLGKVLHHVIIRNWDSLKAGKPSAFPLFVPSKGETFDFEVAYSGKEDKYLKFNLQPSSWIIRQFVDDMIFYYDDSRVLKKYLGPTTIITDAISAEQVVRIEFFYQTGYSLL